MQLCLFAHKLVRCSSHIKCNLSSMPELIRCDSRRAINWLGQHANMHAVDYAYEAWELNPTTLQISNCICNRFAGMQFFFWHILVQSLLKQHQMFEPPVISSYLLISLPSPPVWQIKFWNHLSCFPLHTFINQNLDLRSLYSTSCAGEMSNQLYASDTPSEVENAKVYKSQNILREIRELSWLPRGSISSRRVLPMARKFRFYLRNWQMHMGLSGQRP